MRIEEYLNGLPRSIMNGEDVELRRDVLREIFEFASLSKNDTFYHLGCGTGEGLEIALEEFNVRKATGIDNSSEKIESARRRLEGKISNWELKCEDILQSEITDATVILFWFSDEKIVEKMTQKFSKLREGTRIITIWGPLPSCLPEKVDFPYILNIVPFKEASSLKDQVMAVFGTDCIDFVTAWEFAERYARAIGPDAENNRFLTIIQTLAIWINAKNLGIACGNEIPLPIKNYLGILKTYFNIEMDHLLNQKTS